MAAALVGAWSALAVPAIQAAPRERATPWRFEVIDLGTLGGVQSRALAMNDSGTVVGWSETAGPEVHGFIWQDGVMTELATLGGSWSQATGVNGWGEVIGISATDTGEVHAFFSAEGKVQDLNAVVEWPNWPDDAAAGIGFGGFFRPPPPVLTDVKSINENGWIAGSGQVPGDEDAHGFVLIPGPGDTFDAMDLNALQGTQGVVPYCINDQNTVVGVSGNLAFQWEHGMMFPLDFFTRTVLFESRATGISNRGLAVGWFAEGAPEPHAACTWQGGEHFALDSGGGFSYEATGVNSRGQIVGWSYTEFGGSAVLWEGGRCIDLNDVTVVPVPMPGDGPLFPWGRLVSATAIDENGWIAGYGRSSSGLTRAFLLKPIEVAAD